MVDVLLTSYMAVSMLLQKTLTLLGCFIWLCHLQYYPSVHATLGNKAQA